MKVKPSKINESRLTKSRLTKSRLTDQTQAEQKNKRIINMVFKRGTRWKGAKKRREASIGVVKKMGASTSERLFSEHLFGGEEGRGEEEGKLIDKRKNGISAVFLGY